MRTLSITASLALVAGTAGTALALPATLHQEITERSCRAAGLPDALCVETGIYAYLTDSDEFEDETAHSQMRVGQGECDAVNGVMARVFQLGHDARLGILALRDATTQPPFAPDPGADAVAKALGRAIHSVQDNCAHHGMPNPQHAWWSMSDTCKGTMLSPDLVPAAATCAEQQSDAVFAAVAQTIKAAGNTPGASSSIASALGSLRATSEYYPEPSELCWFLELATTWDGVDRRWDPDAVGKLLRDQLVSALTTNAAAAPDVCANGEAAIARKDAVDPVLDTKVGVKSCAIVHTLCLGKADDGGMDAAHGTHTGGCSAGGGGSQAWLLLALGALLGARRRR